MQIGFSDDEVNEIVEAEVRKRFPMGDDAHVEVTHSRYGSPEWKIEIYSRERWMKKLDRERIAEEAYQKSLAEKKAKEVAEAKAEPVPADAPF